MSDMTPIEATTIQKMLDGASVHPPWTHERQKAPGESLRDCLLNPAPLGQLTRHCLNDAVRRGENAPPRSWKHEAMPTAPPEINFQSDLAMCLTASQIDRGIPVLSAKLLPRRSAEDACQWCPTRVVNVFLGGLFQMTFLARRSDDLLLLAGLPTEAQDVRALPIFIKNPAANMTNPFRLFQNHRPLFSADRSALFPQKFLHDSETRSCNPFPRIFQIKSPAPRLQKTRVRRLPKDLTRVLADARADHCNLFPRNGNSGRDALLTQLSKHQAHLVVTERPCLQPFPRSHLIPIDSSLLAWCPEHPCNHDRILAHRFRSLD